MSVRKPKTGNTVALIVGKPMLGLRKGQVGTVVEQWSETEYTIDFFRLDGTALKSIPVATEEILILHLDEGILRIRAGRSVFKRRASWFFFLCSVVLLLIAFYMMYENYWGAVTTFGGRASVGQSTFGGETVLTVAIIFGVLSLSFRE